MNIEFDEAREHFLKRIKTLEKRLYHADRRGNDQEISDLRRKIKYCREAVRALGQPEVVRCKDCAKDGLFTCPMCYIESHELIFINHDPEFFCGGGERKEGNDNG